MEWMTALQGKVVGLDTTPLIYFIEENPTFLTNDARLPSLPNLQVLIADNLARSPSPKA